MESGLKSILKNKIVIFTVLALLFISNGIAQDIHFTQSNQTPMLINPAATGVFSGWERISFNHKNQWINSGTKFYTTSIAADLNILKPRRGNGAHMGVGLQFYNDIGGDSKFGTRQVLISISGIVPLDDYQQLSGGLQLGMGQKFGDFTTLHFANQFDGQVFDPTNPSGEANNLATFMYTDISTGVFYRYGNHKIGFSRDDALDFRVGFAYFHANKPELRYRLGSTEQLYGKIVIHTSIIKDFDGSKYGLEAFFNQYHQGPHNETLFGALLRYRIKSGSKITGLSRDTYISFGAALRYKDAVSPMLNFQMSSFNFGLSYDITVSDFGQYYRGGGLEFSLKYTNMDFALFKRRR
jgi:type IX secretion system PorP/SprF family membrane protein